MTTKKIESLIRNYLSMNHIHCGSKVKQIKNDLISIAMMDTNGGTEIDNVLKKIEKTNKNSIIIILVAIKLSGHSLMASTLM